VRRVAIQIGSITFAILALELTLIRWMSQQIRVFAYLSNILLIGAFLGIGLGLGLSRRAPRLVDWAMPLLMILSGILAFAAPLGLTYLSFPDRSVVMWGAEGLRVDETYAENLVAILALFALEAAVFACLGAALGAWFDEAPPLRAYSWDLAGSLLGVLAATALAAFRTSPPWWFAIACVPVIVWHSRRWWSIASAAAVIALSALSIEGALFSPYNRIDLRRGTAGTPWILYANRDNHQRVADLSPAAVANAPEREREAIAASAAGYELPFRLPERRRRALISGAGTGNDVAAALRIGFEHVVAVEIDPAIRDAGKRLHPEHPYSDSRVESVITDARTYLETGGRGAMFDTVCFGLLDSHAMFSSMSTLRLDNYVYTVQAMRRAWSRVAPGGVLTISFAIWKQQFISDRIARNLHEATGRWPRIVTGHSLNEQTFIVDKGMSPARLDAVLAAFRTVKPSSQDVAPSTDDWPYLYLRPGVFPAGYVVTLSAVLLLAIAGARAVFGRGFYSARRFDLPLFFMGAAFLLIETRSVTDLSLLFGSTWMVNSAVFAGVLIVAFCANAYVQKARMPRLGTCMAVLFAALLLSWLITPGILAWLPPAAARLAGVIINTLPIGVAGLIFSILLARSPDPAASLGSNLVGAIVGGVTEYASLWIGLHALTAIAAVFYAAAFIVFRRAAVRAPAALPATGQV